MEDKSYLQKQNICDTDISIANQKAHNDVRPSPLDDRDYTFDKVLKTFKEIPEEYKAKSVKILDQGAIGSCVAHACASALASGDLNVLEKSADYSVGYIYANRDDFYDYSEGMFIRSALKQLNKCGDVYEIDFPYNDVFPEVKAKLDANKEALAKKAADHKIINYFRCYTEREIKRTVLATGGVIICIPVYSNFRKDLHKPDDDSISTGYHAMLIIGWTKSGQWIVQNSWGAEWGYSGLLLMDMDYPIDEAWGISVNGSTIDLEEVKAPEGLRAFVMIAQWLRKIIEWWKNFFSNKKKKKGK